MSSAEIAPEIDRLVWAANFAARDRHMGPARALLRDAGMADSWLATLANLAPFFDAGSISESLVRRRYRYRPAAQLIAFVAESEEAGYLTRSGDRLEPTPAMTPLIEAIADGLAASCDALWGATPDAAASASSYAGAVLAADDGSPLLDAHRGLPEPSPLPHRLHHRLSGLRLMRNEAHARAWETHGLTPGDMVALTRVWRGTRSPTDPPDFEVTEALGERGLVDNGDLTVEGYRIRNQIEDDTNRLVEPAFAVLGSDDRNEFLDALRSLPGQP